MATRGDGSDDPSNSAAISRYTSVPDSSEANQPDALSRVDTTESKKKKHRAGKKKKSKRKGGLSVPSEHDEDGDADNRERPSLLDMHPNSSTGQSLYRSHANLSSTSLESEALLDHRQHTPMRPRSGSLLQQPHSHTRPSHSSFMRHRPSNASANKVSARSKLVHSSGADFQEDDVAASDERSPLLHSHRDRSKPEISRNNSERNYGGAHRGRRTSSRDSSRRRTAPVDITNGHNLSFQDDEDYDVNNPPSVPASPILGSLDEPLTGFPSNSDRGRDVVIDIDNDTDHQRRQSSSSLDIHRRRATVADLAERDVCFPRDHPLSEIGEEDIEERRSTHSSAKARRRRRPWPDLEVLENFSREEKEERTHQEHIRAKKISEPVMIGGRLRPAKTVWHRDHDDSPFRFTYFNEHVDGTIHARTIGDLIQDGGSFRELFIPDPPELSDSSEDEDDLALEPTPSVRDSIAGLGPLPPPRNPISRVQSQSQTREQRSPSLSQEPTRSNTPSGQNSQTETTVPARSKRFGPRPTWWLDILQPTEMEMKILAKTFQIHQLTIEDILMEEPREKVELFSNYYFVNYRSFEQDKEDDDFMDPLNFYIIAFKDGVLTFHSSMTPHPANVRRRIRLLNGWTNVNPDWITYALIDDITDAFAPLTVNIEEEVDDIDDEILYMHQLADDAARQNEQGKPAAKQAPKPRPPPKPKGKKFQLSDIWKGTSKSTTHANTGASEPEGEIKARESGGEMLRRVGECRKKVMGLYRLLGNKADVLKGFAKRCNEYWEVAPRHDIGMYLGDIQDHINTMVGNVSHYESLLSRAHSNYVAQINIRMNERAEQNADVLGKLTVLGTIVLPMNIITGMWGMNVWVPGQEYEGDLKWFFAITAGLFLFGLSCFYGARKVYGIV